MLKETIGLIAVLLSLIAYIPYVRDIIKNKTKPHVYSWFIWGFSTSIVFALQTKGGGGYGAWVTLSAAMLSFMVFLLSLRNGKKDITKLDTAFFLVALIAIGLWLLAKQPVLSIVLLVSIDIVGLIPTIRKSWKKPNEETLFLWVINGFRHALSIIALSKYNTLTLFFPVVWAAANILFSMMLIIRRKQID